MVLLQWCLYYFVFVFLMYVATIIISSASDVFKLKLGGKK